MTKYRILVVSSSQKRLLVEIKRFQEAFGGTMYMNPKKLVCGNTTFTFSVLEKLKDCHRIAGLEFGDVILDDMVPLDVERYCISRLRTDSLLGGVVISRG